MVRGSPYFRGFLFCALREFSLHKILLDTKKVIVNQQQLKGLKMKMELRIIVKSSEDEQSAYSKVVNEIAQDSGGDESLIELALDAMRAEIIAEAGIQ